MAARYWLLGCIAAIAFGCGNNSGSGNDANGGGDDGGGGGDDAPGTGIDAPGTGIDAPFSGMCTASSAYQCSNCIDDDSDGKIDGFDAECSGPADRDEASFATGIPGDNIDATDQDCFFDGNSGSGNDGCSQHVCCLLQAGGATMATTDDITACAALAPNVNYNKYVRAECYKPFGSTNVPTKCTMECGPLTPPGCDCFGCCTVCNGSGCEDIILNPAVSPQCDQSNITDPGADNTEGTADDPCKRCVKNTNCGSSECGGATCILCPGQTTLPPECTGGTPTCPTGYMACDSMGNCPTDTYCNNGCCVGSIL
jgi:hypothetical protein